MQQKTLVGFFTEDLEALEQEAVCTPEFGNGRMFYYYMKEGTSNENACNVPFNPGNSRVIKSTERQV